MRVDVVMPQMGESIAEGTITRWLKKQGERVERDEPILEISTDKVDAEIPSPASGVLVETRGGEGETVEVNAVVGVIETEESAAATESEPRAAREAEDKPAAAPQKRPPAAAPAQKPQRDKSFVSPVVRKIAEEQGIDPEQIEGSGAGGRVTKKDILAHLEQAGAAAAAPGERQAAAASAAHRAAAAPAPSAAAPRAATTTQTDAPSFAPGRAEVRVAMTAMRKRIAEHMVESRRVSAHVNSVFEVDVSHLVRLREAYKQLYLERHGTSLTYMAFFIKSVCDGLRAWPILNAAVEGGEIVYKKDLNIGVAVALDWGLIVPVVRQADELSIAGLCKRVNDLAQRARAKKLNPDEVSGGTFTITNPGTFGGLYGLPIINQPQVAILGIGGIEKRPVVIADAIAIRSMMYVTMSYDHRVVDGAVAEQFLARFKHGLESFDESLL